MLKSVVNKCAYALGLEVRRRNSGTWATVVSRSLSQVLEFDGVATAFDVGAFEGETADLFLTWFPQAEVHAFEPFNTTYATLSARFEGRSRAHTVNCAVAESAGEVEFFVTASQQSNSTLRPLQTGRAVDENHTMLGSTRVKKTSLDIYCDERGVASIDILKLDVQGAELAVLKGAEGLLSLGAIKAIVTEVEFVELYDKQPLFCDISGFLKKYGYILFTIPRQVPDELGQLCWADAIFVRSDLLEAARARLRQARR